MANVDRTYIQTLLAQIKTGEDGRLDFYRTQPYPAMRIIAEDRVHSLQLLIEAVNGGLLERLVTGGTEGAAPACCSAAEMIEHDPDCETRRDAESGAEL